MNNNPAEKRQTCPVCGEIVIDLAHLKAGRPKKFCSIACRRASERRRRAERAAKRHAAFLASLPEGERQMHLAAARSDAFGGRPVDTEATR